MEAVLSARHEYAYLLEGSAVVAIATLDGVETSSESLSTVASWLQSVEEPVFLRDVAADQVVLELRKQVAVDHTFRLLLIFSDDDLSDETRELATSDLEDLLTEWAILYEQLATTFYAKPMPPSVDLSAWLD